MYALFDYIPKNPSDSRINTITASSQDNNWPVNNLKNISPVKVWKSTSTSEQWVKYYFGSTAVSYRHLFLNRFNFSNFKVYVSSNDSSYTQVADISGCNVDEISEEKYVHIWVDMGASLSYKYLKLVIPSQTPLFEPSYFKIGNMLVGNGIEIYNPRPGYEIMIVPKRNFVEFDSGNTKSYKMGRTRRTFVGEFDKFSVTEYNKIVKTYEPIIIYHDWIDQSAAYLVKLIKEISKNYTMHNVLSMSFAFEEIV